MASSTAPRRGSDVLLTTLDHPGAGVARDGGGEQREYAYYVFQDSCNASHLQRASKVITLNKRRDPVGTAETSTYII